MSYKVFPWRLIYASHPHGNWYWNLSTHFVVAVCSGVVPCVAKRKASRHFTLTDLEAIFYTPTEVGETGDPSTAEEQALVAHLLPILGVYAAIAMKNQAPSLTSIFLQLRNNLDKQPGSRQFPHHGPCNSSEMMYLTL